MDTDYSAEQEELRTTLRRFLEERAPLAFVRERWREPRPETPELWRGMAELGLLGLLIPEEAGGFGGGMRDLGVVMEELGRAVHPGPYWASAVGTSSAALALGAAELLPGLAEGSRIGTLAIEEPDRSFASWREPRLIAKAGELYGRKLRVPDALAADFFLVTANDGVYLVKSDAQRVALTHVDGIDGSRRFADLRLEGAFGERLGPLETLAPVIDRMLVAQCADGLGAAERLLELSVEYAKERVQFGRPIGAFQAVAHMCADMLERVELARAGLHYALWAADEAPAEEAHRAAVMAKAYASEELPRVGADAIQIFGGAGFTWEYDLHLYYKRLLALEQLWGGPEAWLEELAKIALRPDCGTLRPDPGG